MSENQLTLEIAIYSFLDFCESKNLTNKTIHWYKQHLQKAARFLSTRTLFVSEITVADLRDWVTDMLGSVSAATVNHHITTMKTFFHFLVDEGVVQSSPAERLPQVKGVQKLIRPFSPEQINALITAPNEKRFSGFRDRRIMMLLLDTALRISEAVHIKMQDIDWSRNLICIIGKGGKERIVPFGKTVRTALREYIERRGDVDTDFLFVNELGDPISVKQIQQNIASYGRKLEITNVRVSPHTFRHTAAVNWVRNGGDIFSLQRLLGHSSLEMVRRYCNLANEDLERVHKTCSPVDRMIGLEQHGRSPRKRLK